MTLWDMLDLAYGLAVASAVTVSRTIDVPLAASSSSSRIGSRSLGTLLIARPAART
jgi:hypothetical protein